MSTLASATGNPHHEVSRRRLWRRLEVLIGVAVIVLWSALALLASRMAPYGYDEQRVDESLQPPGASHLFGTDDLGRDVLSRVLYGGRVTLLIGLGVVVVGGAVGTAVGAVSAYAGGLADEAIMRATEVIMAFPSIILAMAIAVAMGPGIWHAAMAMALVWWPGYARLARAEVLGVKPLGYVEAAVAIGQRPLAMLWRTITPNILPRVLVLATADLGNAVVTAAGLSFLGLGAIPPTPEWGQMVSAGREMPTAWWMATFPGLAIFTTVLAFNFLGDALRDHLDPRHRA
jgi:peptide/nickel transport system permease protein